jgi:hypothetical protein
MNNPNIPDQEAVFSLPAVMLGTILTPRQRRCSPLVFVPNIQLFTCLQNVTAQICQARYCWLLDSSNGKCVKTSGNLCIDPQWVLVRPISSPLG